MPDRHRDRTTDQGERYVKKYRLEKWINQCLGCQERGYSPEMPSAIAQNKYGRGEHVADYVRSKFRPLALDADGLCENCKREP